MIAQVKKLDHAMTLPRNPVALAAPAGRNFIRAAVATALTQGRGSAERLAEARWGGQAGQEIKSVIAAGTTTNLSEATGPAARAFLAAVGERSVIGRLPGLRRLPFRVAALTPADGLSAAWRGEGAATPVSAAALDASELEPYDLGALAIFTKQLLESDTGEAEAWIRRDLLRVISEALDAAFLDPGNSGTMGVKPASVFAGVAASASYANLDGARDLISGSTGDLTSSAFILHPATAIFLSGSDAPDLGALGGSILGIPVLTTRAFPDGSIGLIDAGGIAYAEAGGEVRASETATVEMDSAPTGDATTPTATETVSLWQTNSRGLIVNLTASWARIRTGAAQWIDGAI